MKKFFQTVVHKFFLIERDPKKLAWTTCLGLFIGFSPFLGLQTPLVFLFAWLFSLPASILFSVVYIVNNPFLTTIPIIIANYLTGYLIFTYIIPVDLYAYNPTWFAWLENKIRPSIGRYLGINEICFWDFMVGGVVFAILFSVPFYPLLKRFYTRLSEKYENNSPK
jgi:uncharacterized protein (DUF2062 family)